jgi:hypothetical protein
LYWNLLILVHPDIVAHCLFLFRCLGCMAAGNNLEAYQLLDLTGNLPIVRQLVSRISDVYKEIYKQLEPTLEDVWRAGIACTLQVYKNGLTYEHSFPQTDRIATSRTLCVFFSSPLKPQDSEQTTENIHTLLELPGTVKSFITKLCDAKSKVNKERKEAADQILAAAAAREPAAVAETTDAADQPAAATKTSKKRSNSSRGGSYHPNVVRGWYACGNKYNKLL